MQSWVALTGSWLSPNHCTTSVSCVVLVKVVEPDVEVPVTIRLYVPGAVPPPLLLDELLQPADIIPMDNKQQAVSP
jgi:hypothetical protein